MAETSDIKVEVVENDEDVVFIDVEPPMTEFQKSEVQLAPEFYDLRKAEAPLPIRDFTPDRGEPFSEIDCTKLRGMVRELGLVLDARNFARQLAEILGEHGDAVELVMGIPLELRSHKFLGLTPEAPTEKPI
jgi:hypothetical protein